MVENPFVCHGRVGRASSGYSMVVTPVYRKTKRTYNEPGHAHFITCSCYQRWPLLAKDRSRLWVIESLRNLREKFTVDLWAYVIMPEHVHLLLRPRRPEYRMEHLLAAFKRPISATA